MFSPTVPYNELPPIPASSELETPKTLKKAISANRTLAELKASGDLIPNQVVLLRAILLQEAKASSEIENVVTTNDALYRALDLTREDADPHTREVLRYGAALWTGFDEVRAGQPIQPTLLVRLAQAIKAVELGVREYDGCQVVNDRTREIIYTPPVGKEAILQLLDDLCSYLHDDTDGTDPLIKMAAAHYQFEAIHPLPDGNGRTGRVVNILYLVSTGMLSLPILYLSGFIVRNKPAYYDLLRGVTERGEWEPWILYMLEAVETTARVTLQMLKNVRNGLEDGIQQARTAMNRGYSRELLELVFSQPYTRIAHVEQAGIAKRNTASMYLQELTRIGLLRSIKHGRERLFFNPTLMAALTPPDSV